MDSFGAGVVAGMEKVAGMETMYFVEGGKVMAMDQKTKGPWANLMASFSLKNFPYDASTSKQRAVTGAEAQKARQEARRLGATVVVRKSDGHFEKLGWSRGKTAAVVNRMPKKTWGGAAGLVGSSVGGAYGPFTHDGKLLSEIAPKGAYEPLRRLGENIVKKPPVTGGYGVKRSKAS